MSLEQQIAQLVNPDDFVRLCNAVFTAVYQHDYQAIDGTRGDEGIDGYVISESRVLAIYCPKKPGQRTDRDYVNKAKDDLAKAANWEKRGDRPVRAWTFVTPSKLANSVLNEIEREAARHRIASNHVESTYLAERLRLHSHLIGEFAFLEVELVQQQLSEVLQILRGQGSYQEAKGSEEARSHVIQPPTGEPDPENEEVRRLRIQSPDSRTKPALRVLWYQGRSVTARANAILGLVDLFNPEVDSPMEFAELCEQGVALVQQMSSPLVCAFLHAQRAYFLVLVHVRTDTETTASIQMENQVGLGLFTEHQRQQALARLNELENKIQKSWRDAFAVIKSHPDAETLATVCVIMGNAAGIRACTLDALGNSAGAMAQFTQCKRALLTAKELYERTNDEEGVATALLNLANQIRFFGEVDEARDLTSTVISTAQRIGDSRLESRGRMLLVQLDSEVHGERIVGRK